MRGASRSDFPSIRTAVVGMIAAHGLRGPSPGASPSRYSPGRHRVLSVPDDMPRRTFFAIQSRPEKQQRNACQIADLDRFVQGNPAARIVDDPKPDQGVSRGRRIPLHFPPARRPPHPAHRVAITRIDQFRPPRSFSPEHVDTSPQTFAEGLETSWRPYGTTRRPGNSPLSPWDGERAASSNLFACPSRARLCFTSSARSST